MNYNSYSFWLFYLAVLVLYWRLDHRRQNKLMLVASYVFYGFWDYRFLFLILLSTVIDFIGGLGVAGIELPRRRLRGLGVFLVASALLLCGGVRYAELWQGLLRLDGAQMLSALPTGLRDLAVPIGTAAVALVYGALLPHLYRLPAEHRRRCFLAISMVANLVILGFFKYCDFFIASLHGLLSALGLPVSLSTLGILLPAGISFYTFQAMSYTIDIYRNEVAPTDDFADFALFVCFFPHLVAGPIMRAHTLLPQVVQPRRLQPGAVEEGAVLVGLGLFKKIVIADNMAPIANAVFFRFAEGKWMDMSGAEALAGVYAFAFQIYGDFSGYSSIARGISKWLGFELVQNFRMPYLATSPSDFWRRWHISLSSWLRDYLYIPLGGNRGGARRQYRNLMLTMLLGGLWHGASWTFVAWGFYHGLLLCLFRLFRIPDAVSGVGWIAGARRLGRVVLMFHLTCIGWLLFRADTFSTAWNLAVLVLTRFTVTPMFLSAMATIAFYNLVLFLLEWALDGENRIERLLDAAWPVQGAAYAYVVLMILLFHAGQAYEFIYFQF
ncbi:MAG: MBOAT family O-acyltransferase [Myxococcales bacterium]|nr:MBOAT family protein [Myxococcota bacterium]MDW8280929.1 MBOAT family O-acyltransferase [Myxococcales bacterium]